MYTIMFNISVYQPDDIHGSEIKFVIAVTFHHGNHHHESVICLRVDAITIYFVRGLIVLLTQPTLFY